MTVKEEDINEGRRRFLLSGALVVSFSMVPGVSAMAQEVIADEGAAVHIGKATQTLAGSLKTNPYLDSWIRIDRAGNVTVYTGKVELGTGVRTALLQTPHPPSYSSTGAVGELAACVIATSLTYAVVQPPSSQIERGSGPFCS